MFKLKCVFELEMKLFEKTTLLKIAYDYKNYKKYLRLYLNKLKYQISNLNPAILLLCRFQSQYLKIASKHLVKAFNWVRSIEFT